MIQQHHQDIEDRANAPSRGTAAWRIGAIAWLAVIGWCTLRSLPAQAADVALLPWYCVVCGDTGVADILLNVLLLLPLGVALHRLGWPLWRATLTVCAISTSIELIQGYLLVGRDACIGDVLSNTTGGLIGWLGDLAIPALARPTIRLAWRGSVGLLALMAAVWMATGAGLQPSLTETFPWIGQPMHAGRGVQPFPGTLQRVTLDGVDIPEGTMPGPAPWRDSIVVEINATRDTAALFRSGIVMLRVVDSAHTVQMAIDQRGDDAWLRLRLHASDWRLHYPRWLVSHGMAMAPRVPWRFRWSWHRDRFTIVNEPIGGPSHPPISIPLSIGLGWIFIHPFVSLIGENRLLWTALWLAWWFGLLGWLAGRLRNAVTLLIGLVAIGSYVAVSMHWGMDVQAVEVGVAIGAFLLAASAGALAARHSA